MAEKKKEIFYGSNKAYDFLDEPKIAIAEAIRAELKEKKLSVRALGEKIGMFHAVIVRVTGLKNYHIDTLIRILDGLDLELVVRKKSQK